MLFKTIVVILLLFIIFSLFSGLFYLVKDKTSSDKMLKSLSIRIGLSVLLFVILMIGYATGLIAPHAGPPVPM